MEYRLNHTKGFHGKPRDTPRKKHQANAHAAVAFISPCIFPLGLPRTENAVLSSTPKEEEQQDEEGKKNKFKL